MLPVIVSVDYALLYTVRRRLRLRRCDGKFLTCETNAVSSGDIKIKFFNINFLLKLKGVSLA